MSSMEQMRRALLSTISQVRDASQTVTHAAQEIASGNIDRLPYRATGFGPDPDGRQHGRAERDGGE